VTVSIGIIELVSNWIEYWSNYLIRFTALLRWWCPIAGKLTAGLSESIGIPTPGFWLSLLQSYLYTSMSNIYDLTLPSGWISANSHPLLRPQHEPSVGDLSAPHRTSRLRHLSTLQWCWWDGRTSGVTLPSTRPRAAGVMAKSPLSKRPKTSMELPGEDRDCDPSPRPGMRESPVCNPDRPQALPNFKRRSQWTLREHNLEEYSSEEASKHYIE